MKWNIQCLFVLLGILTTQSACSDLPKEYAAEAIEARVVDAETQKPLEDVVVTANWQLFHSTVGGRVPGSQLMVMEAVTDKEGRFHFPAWGPKKVPNYKPQAGDVWIAHIPFLVPDGYLDNHDPQLLLFKPGYEHKRLANKVSSKTNMASRRRSEWNGKTIELKPFKGTGEEYARHLGSLSLSWAYTGEECEWKKIPHMVFAAHKQAMAFKRQKIVTDLYTIDNLIPYEAYPDKCGAREYFKEHRP